MTVPTIAGAKLPLFLYGTAWKDVRTADLVKEALRAGFRGIDTANQRKHYHEAGVGDALREAFAEGLVARDQVFVQTKFTYRPGQDHRLPYDPNAAPPDQVRQSLASSLEHLGVDKIDSFVLHGPSVGRGLADVDFAVWETMVELLGAGRTRYLGVSNISLAQLELLCAKASRPPTFVQNRCFAATGWDREVRRFCRDQNMIYQGFSLLTANGRELSSPAVAAIARRVGRSIAQVTFRFALQVGMLPLTGTTDPEHMRIDLEVADFSLTDDDVATIEHLG